MSIKRWTIGLLATCVCACGKEPAASDGVFSTRTTAAAAADAVDGGGAQAPRPLGAALRAKLKLLAVQSECMRRGDAPADEIADKMLALYKTHDVDLAVYAREMGRLGGDATFQGEIQAELERCPTPAVALGAPPTDVTDGPETSAAAEDVAPADDMAVATTLEGPLAAVDAGATDDVGPAVVVDTKDELVDSEADVAKSGRKDGLDDLSGTWTGAVRGGLSATLRVIVRGRRVSSATMTWSGRNVRLQGTIANNGQMSLGGRISQSDFVRLRGRIKKTGHTLSGTWDGVIDRKRASGTIQLSR